MDEPSPYAVAYLKRLKRLEPGGRMLDVGCGEGRHAFAAAKLGFKVTGIDYEPLAIERARRFARSKSARGIAFRKADVFRLPFPRSSFDVVLDYGCLHHQRKSDWRAYDASILRVLRSGGYYVLSAFSPEFRLFRGSSMAWQIAYGAYRRRFTAKEIVELFGRDFEVMEMVRERGEGHGFWHVLMRRSRVEKREEFNAKTQRTQRGGELIRRQEEEKRASRKGAKAAKGEGACGRW